MDGLEKGATEETKADAKEALDAARYFLSKRWDRRNYRLFLEHLGLATSISSSARREPRWRHHSRYYMYEHFIRFGDPGMTYTALLAKTVGRLVLRAADADLPIQQAGDFARTVSNYLEQVKKLESDKRAAAETQAQMLRESAFGLAADPTLSNGGPTPLKSVPVIDLSAMDVAVKRLSASAKDYDAAVAQRGSTLSASTRARLNLLMLSIDQTLAPPIGLPGRPWFKNLIYAPGRYTGYGAKTLPGITESIEEERWADANTYAKLTADALNAYSARLDQATGLLDER